FSRDWSSDVCSSDLERTLVVDQATFVAFVQGDDPVSMARQLFESLQCDAFHARSSRKECGSDGSEDAASASSCSRQWRATLAMPANTSARPPACRSWAWQRRCTTSAPVSGSRANVPP